MKNQPTKFVVPTSFLGHFPNFARYGNMKGVAKYRKWGGLGDQGSPKVIGNSAIRQSAYDFLLAFHSQYVSILHRFRDLARYWSKITDLNLPHLCLAPPLDWIFAEIFGIRKLGVPGLSYGVCQCDPRFSCLCTSPTCNRQTDGSTDRQTERQTDTR